MIYYVYMLKSKGVKPVTYVGYTNNLAKRINLHNSGKGAKFTRGRIAKVKGYKKAIVTLKKGQSIDLTTGI